MKFSWNWLGRYVDLADVDPYAAAERFTLSVAELEAVHLIGAGLDKIITGRVIDLRKHPKNEKLSIARVDLGGDNYVTSVSSAPNLAVGAVVPVALPDTELPGGRIVKRVDFNGVTSCAVILSEKEMDISDDHSGVMILDGSTPPGKKLTAVIPVRDYIFEVDNKSITHRPDLWGHYGIAREVAAILGKRLEPLEYSFPEGGADSLKVSIFAPELCPRYMALHFTGIKVAESPFWLKQALRSVGVRPINNIVDITNYVMFDIGNPLHAFDFGFLKGSEIQIRRAVPGEIIVTLDGVKRNLTSEDLVIADIERPVAIAGVMGGENSEINPRTNEIVLESANFNAASVRRTAIRHSMRTEASSRFEKSLDPDFAEIGTGLFTRMLLGLVPEARVHSRLYDEGNWRHERKIIHISCAYIRERLGAEIPDGEIVNYLGSLQFGVRKSDQILEVEVPSWRATKDISIPEDIVEEIGRLYGYNNIVPVPPKMIVKAVGRLPHKILEERVKDLMSLALGFYEISTYSFDSQSFLKKIGYMPKNQVFVKNPISQDFLTLRTDLEPNILSSVEKNANRKKSFRIYEVGRIFSSVRTAENLPAEELRLCGAIRLQTRERDKYDAVFYDIKGVAEALLSKLGIRFSFERVAKHQLWMHPARSVDILSRGIKIGSICEVHPEVMHKLDLQGRCALMSLSLTEMLKVGFDEFRYSEIPKFPGIQYDISVIVPVEVEARELKEIIGRSGSDLIKEIEIFAVYEGDPIPEGKKSVSFSILFQSRDKTLEDSEVQEIIKKIVRDFESVGGYLRMN